MKTTNGKPMELKYGTMRPQIDQSKIFLKSITGMKYGVTGFCSDLAYYQGEDSIFKAQRIAAQMDDAEKGKELIDFVRESNTRMELEYNSERRCSDENI